MNKKKKMKKCFKRESGTQIAWIYSAYLENEMRGCQPYTQEMRCEAISPVFKKLKCDASQPRGWISSMFDG